MRFAAALAVMLWCLNAVAVEYVTQPQDVRPLMIGAQAPLATELHTVEGAQTSLARAMVGRPALLVFFRGGWCPYCDLQLSELRLIEDDLKALGYEVIAISPDAPRAMKARRDQNALSYTLLSDDSSELIRAFGIAYTVNLPPASVKGGPASRLLPITSVYVLDAKGKVQFQYVNPDYRVRVPKELLLAAAKASLLTAQ